MRSVQEKAYFVDVKENESNKAENSRNVME